MKINYHAPFSINPFLKEFVEEKMERLENLNLRFGKADVFFKLKEGNHAPEDKEVEIKIQVPKQTFFAKSFADNFETAIPLAIGKIRKQMVKYKEAHEPKRSSSLK